MRRKTRTILTILSVVIGIFSIVLMLSFGFGIQKQQENITSRLRSLKSIEVYSTHMGDPRDNRTPTTGVINDEIINKLKRNPKIRTVFALGYVPANLRSNRSNIVIRANIISIDTESLKKAGIKLQNGIEIPNLKKGEFLITDDLQVKKRTGRGRRENYEIEPNFNFSLEKFYFRVGYRNEDAGIFEEQNLGKNHYEVKAKFTGRLERNEFISERTIIVNEETAEVLRELEEKLEMQGEFKVKPKKRNKIYERALVFVHNMEDIETVTKEINDMDLSAQSEQSFINAERERTRILQFILGGIGSIALFVAAIGISNTMLMSIQERTKEIGIMKVIGAQIIDIRKMFLIEAILIGILGGIVGLILSFGVSELINALVISSLRNSGYIDEDIIRNMWQGISYIPFWLPFIAVIFSGFIGLLAGYLPAHKATKLSAIESIRNN